MSAPARPGGGGAIAEYFKFAQRGTTMGTEVKAGVATFLVMSYIIAVNPSILGAAGVPVAAAAAATALIAGILSIAMGVIANMPIALAAGLGINAAVAFGLVIGQGLTWQAAMGVIVLEGLLVLVLVIVGLREAVMNAVPMSLKRAIGVGIGLFILFIGFSNAGLIRGAQAVPVEFVYPTTPGHAVFLVGLVITVALFVRRIPAALILSIVITTVLGLVVGVAAWPEGGIVQAPDFQTLGAGLTQLDGVFLQLGVLAALLTIFAFMLTDFFDTMGTATAISEQAGLSDEKGRVPGIGRLLGVDSVGAILGGAAGISSNTAYIESAAGVAEGGRTGFTAVVTGLLFFAAILLAPLVTLVPAEATAPVLVVVGFLMVSLIKDINFTDVEEGMPALFGLILMPLTFSITVGIGAGFVMYAVVKTVRGKAAEVHPLMWLVAIAFLVYFAQDVIEPLLPRL